MMKRTVVVLIFFLSLSAPIPAYGFAVNKGFGKKKMKNKRPSSASSGGGGGGGFGTQSNSGAREERGTKGKPKSQLLLEFETYTETEEHEDEDESVQLDKWGLPPPTLDDVFPPMDPSTELQPAPTDPAPLADVCQALDRFTPIDLSLFDEQGRYGDMEISLLHRSPPVLVIDNFLTVSECANIASVAGLDGGDANQDRFTKVESAMFSNTVAQSRRTSTSWFCHYQTVPTLLAKMEHILGWDSSTLEEPQIVSYQPGQEFTWHYDEVPRNQLVNGGQRVATFLVYLNDVGEGGATEFRDLSSPSSELLSVQPFTGRALVFFPADAEGTPDERTLHRGTPPVSEKRIVQVWKHQTAYRATLPPGNRQDDAEAAVVDAKKRLGYM